MTTRPYTPRSADKLINELIATFPALMVVGPRASGKTTTAARHAATIIRLDQPTEAAIFRADPDAALRGLKEPILLDEWQTVPEVLGAVKRAVDTGYYPGRFILTGSVRAELDVPMWPGTGRVIRVPMFGMSVAELEGRPDSMPLIDRLAGGLDPVVPPNPPDVRGYIDLALKSGFPEAALSASIRSRTQWIDSYLEQMMVRDAVEVAGTRDPDKFRRFFEVYALNSAGMVDDQTLVEATGVNRKTVIAYEQTLINLMMAERLPAWFVNRLKRLVKAPKRYLIDPTLAAGALKLNAAAIARDGNMLGRILDTFVVSQMRSGLTASELRPRLHHLRKEQGRHEVDVVAEVGAGQIVAFEIKASAAPTANDAKHLCWLRDELGDKFIQGVVLHTGPRVFKLDEKIIAAPIACLWG